MTSFKQIAANRANAQKSTGPVTEEGKWRSRRNAVRHGLTAETVIRTLEDAEDYRAFEAGVIADYDAQSAVERELVLRLANLLWRLRRAATMETGLFEIHAEQDGELQHERRVNRAPSNIVRSLLAPGEAAPTSAAQSATESTPSRAANFTAAPVDSTIELAHCFLHLANLPNFALDRLSRYEATLMRQVSRVLFALDALDRCKPQERGRRSRAGCVSELRPCDRDEL
jgi:hypothetical protein